MAFYTNKQTFDLPIQRFFSQVIFSYILDCHKVMESNKGTTRPATIKSGVPQGSILGPTLVHILMFLNDLHLFSDYYADVVTVHKHGNIPN